MAAAERGSRQRVVSALCMASWLACAAIARVHTGSVPESHLRGRFSSLHTQCLHIMIRNVL